MGRGSGAKRGRGPQEREKAECQDRPLGILEEAGEGCKGEGVMGVLGSGRAPELRRVEEGAGLRGPWGAGPGLGGAES